MFTDIWNVRLRSLLAVYQDLGRNYSLHAQIRITLFVPWRCRHIFPPRRWYLSPNSAVLQSRRPHSYYSRRENFKYLIITTIYMYYLTNVRFCSLWRYSFFFFFQWFFQLIQGPGFLLSSVIIFHRRQDSLDEWSARHKDATYTQDNTNTDKRIHTPNIQP
jgi:hypothetical protein